MGWWCSENLESSDVHNTSDQKQKNVNKHNENTKQQKHQQQNDGDDDDDDINNIVRSTRIC